MLWGGVAACHSYGVCSVRCAEYDCRTQLFAVLSATVPLNTERDSSTQHS